MRVAVDQSRHERLAASLVDLGVGVRPENRIGRTDSRNPVRLDGDGRVLEHRVGRHDGRVAEHDGARLRRLRANAVLLEQERSRAGAGAGEHFPPRDIRRVASGLGARLIRRSRHVSLRHAAPIQDPILDPILDLILDRIQDLVIWDVADYGSRPTQVNRRAAAATGRAALQPDRFAGCRARRPRTPACRSRRRARQRSR